MTKEEYLNSDFIKIAHLNNQVAHLTQKNKKLEKEKKQLKQQNKQLKARIEKMKCCGNCFHNNKPSDKEFCWNCDRQLDEQPIIKDEWEITE